MLVSILRRLKSRAEFELKRLSLRYKYCFNKDDTFVDYGEISLLFTNDGDRQELRYHLNAEVWYQKEKRILEPLIQRGATAVDVGANSGFMTVLFSKLVGESGKVFAFEPSKRIYTKLLKTVGRNSARNVQLINLGCGSTHGEYSLWQISDSSGHATLVPAEPGQNESSQSEQVRLVKLDDFVKEQGVKVDFLKIDAEGFESEVLSGCEMILRDQKPTIYIELSEDYRESSDRSIAILKKNGYSFLQEPDLESAGTGDNFIAIPEGRT
jgi:FkbM family methyltransferase